MQTPSKTVSKSKLDKVDVEISSSNEEDPSDRDSSSDEDSGENCDVLSMAKNADSYLHWPALTQLIIWVHDREVDRKSLPSDVSSNQN